MKHSLSVKAFTLGCFAICIGAFIFYQSGYFSNSYPEAMQGSPNGGNITNNSLSVPSKQSQDSVENRRMLPSSKVAIPNSIPLMRDTLKGRYSQNNFSGDTVKGRAILPSSKSVIVTRTYTDTLKKGDKGKSKKQ